jgi:hypothetical protein
LVQNSFVPFHHPNCCQLSRQFDRSHRVFRFMPSTACHAMATAPCRWTT